MSITEKEAVASLRLLVAVAKADGALTDQERDVIEDAWEGVDLTSSITPQNLFESNESVDALVTQVVSQEARDAAFAACFAMAYANRECLPQEQALLEKLEKAWEVPHDKKGLIGRIVREARDTIWITHVEPTADHRRREGEVRGDVVKYSVLAAVLGLNPIPVASIATDIAVVGLQAKMFSDIGHRWGRQTSRDAVKQVLAGLGIGTGARVAVNALVKFVPGFGSVFAASTNFASTWALGQVANQYWESGGHADTQMLGEIFKKSRTEGKRAYEQHKAEVEAKNRACAPLLAELNADYKLGRITLADYERKAAELR